jgi:hypothetical protein
MTQRGGARPGAGRKKGGHNRITERAIEHAKAGGILPLDFMLQVMRDEDETRPVRLDAAKAAAQYVHPKLSAIEADISGKVLIGSVLDELPDD